MFKAKERLLRGFTLIALKAVHEETAKSASTAFDNILMLISI